ncbi:HlyD family type I secretion periplasmic adaptor subunit [Azonexus sp.]|uniref:HlyD family type I secretion periplasmic adaptor subunit n=1 Tax=Azonexus sp. TaxID=1872668 RepID=UPI0035B3FA21
MHPHKELRSKALVLGEDRSLDGIVEEGRARRVGFFVVVSTFVLFGGWAALAPIGSAVVAPGVVKVELDRKTLQHLEGGIIHQIHVREGDHVERDQVLITLEQTQFQADLDVARSQTQALLASEARLKAELQGASSIAFPEDFVATDPETARLMQSETALFNARRASRSGELRVLEGRIQQSGSQIAGLSRINGSKHDTLRSLESELADLQRLVAKNFISRHKLNQTERLISELQAEIAENDANIANQQVQQQETRMLIDFRKSEFRTQDVDALTEIQKRLDEMRKKSLSLADRVERASIRAPVAGQVMGLQVNTTGAVLRAGTPILDIVPAGAALLIEARISPADVDTVHTGQLADIRFTGFKATTTPVVEGKLVYLAADRLVDQHSGLPYFNSHIQLTATGLSKLQQLGLQIQPGIPAEVIVKTGERTLLQYIVQPLSNVLARTFREQ